MKQIIHEITPINNEDFFILLNYPDASFDFPTHYHYEYEINLVMDFVGKRIVGDSIESISGTDLVLIGPNTFHSWESTPDFHTDPKGSRGQSQTSSVFIAPLSPPQRRNPCNTIAQSA